MPEKESLFRKESMDQLSRQAETGPYVRTSRLSAWLILAAALVLVVTFLVWAFVGELPVSVSCRGITLQEGGGCILFISPQTMQAHKVKQGDMVQVERPAGEMVSGIVRDISATPSSQEDLYEVVQDAWIVTEVTAGDYNYLIDVEAYGDFEGFEIVDAVITVDQVHPISLLLAP